MKASRILLPSIFLLTFLITTGLTGCGGGSDNDDEKITSTLSGTANKGIIIDGVVNAYKIKNGLIESTPIATGTTDDKGKYSLNISDYSGPLQVVVSAGANSKMKCDAINGCDTDDNGTLDANFGDTISMPSTLKMEAIIPKLTGGTVNGSVNPLTHMAAAYAKSYGMGELGIQVAIDRIEALFDIDDLLGTDPLDITDSSAVSSATTSDVNALKIAYLSAAIAKIAGEEFNGDVAAALNLLATNYAVNKGELIYNLISQDNPDNDANEITLLEISTASLETMASAKVADNANLDAAIEGELTTQKSSADSAAEGTKTTTTIVVTSSDLDAAKAIVETVRTWSTQLTELDEKGQLFGDELDTAQVASELAMDTAGDGLLNATAAAAVAYINTKHLASPPLASIAGKSITFDEGSEDEVTFTFTCSGDIIDGDLSGEYLNNGNKMYLWFDEGSSNIVTIPASSVATGQTWSVNEYNSEGNKTDTFTVVVSTIENYQVCDLSGTQSLADYIDSIDPTLTSTTTGTVIVSGTGVTVAGEINGADINMSFTMPELVSASFTLALNGTVSVANKANLTIGNRSSANILLAASHDLLDEFTEPPAFKSADFGLDITIEQGNKDDTNNTIADPVKFTGLIEFSGVAIPGTDWEDLDINPSKLKMSGDFSRTVSGQNFGGSFDATMSNANSFVPVQPLAVGHIRNDLVSYSFSSDGNTLSVTAENQSTTYSFNPDSGIVTVSEAYGSGYSSEYDDGSGWTSLADYLDYKTASSTGYYKWYAYEDCEGEYAAKWPATGFNSTGGNLPAKLLDSDECDEDETNWRNIQGTLSIDAKFTGLPKATMTVNADRTGYQAGSGSVSFSYDDITITLSGSGDDSTEVYDINLLVTDTSGVSPVRLTIYPDTESDTLHGSVVVNGNVVGVINESLDEKILTINFIDGSFETVTF